MSLLRQFKYTCTWSLLFGPRNSSLSSRSIYFAFFEVLIVRQLLLILDISVLLLFIAHVGHVL